MQFGKPSVIRKAFICCIAVVIGGCEVKWDGVSVGDAFSDPQVVKLVKRGCDGDLEGMQSLISAGVDVNAQDSRGKTPLVWLLKCEKLDAIKLLLEKGADPNIREENSYTFTSYGCLHENPDVLRLALQHGGDPNHTFSAIPCLEHAVNFAGRSDENFYTLLEHGAKINHADEFGSSAATTAAALHRFDLVEVLLDRGYNVHLDQVAGSLYGVVVDPFSELAELRERLLLRLEDMGADLESRRRFFANKGMFMNKRGDRLNEDGSLKFYGDRAPPGGSEIFSQGADS